MASWSRLGGDIQRAWLTGYSEVLTRKIGLTGLNDGRGGRCRGEQRAVAELPFLRIVFVVLHFISRRRFGQLMAHSYSNFDEQEWDELLPADSNSATGLATLDLEEDEPDIETEAVEWTGPRCEKCEAPMKSDVVTICRRCGWYASLGMFVEVDPNWETSDEDEPTHRAQPSHVGVWLNLLPKWGWVMVASVVVVCIESIVVRLVTPADSWLRTGWSLTQLAVGVLSFVGCHGFNFLVLVAEDAEFGLLDLLLKPVKLWVRAGQLLPKRLWVANSALCGLVAVVMSLVVIGGIPYERLWDWGFEQPPKQDLMGAVMDRAKKLGARDGAGNLEDAVGDFAGTQNVDDEEGGAQPSTPAKPRDKTDCVILGYQVDQDGRLAALVLGIANRGQLAHAGQVVPEMPEDERSNLLQVLKGIRSKQPFITLQVDDAIWVQPKYTCRVTFEEKQKTGRLTDIKWHKLLGSMEVGKN